MNIPTPAQARVDLYEQQSARKRFAMSPPIERARIIGTHYGKLAHMAISLSNICEAAQQSALGNSNEQLISYLFDKLRQEYLHDFGTEPTWNLPIYGEPDDR